MSQFKSTDHFSSLDVSTKKKSPETRIQGFVSDQASESVLHEVLDEFQPGNFSISCLSCSVAIAKLRKGASPDVIIIDVSGEEQPVTILVELSNILEPNVKVLVVGERQDANFYRQLTRGLGVAEYLYKPLNRSMVTRFFGPYLAEDEYVPDAARGGRVLGFIGARGGVGTTTIVANFSWYLGEVARRHTLIVDADLYTGAISVLLGVKADGGLRTAFESPQRVDELFVERSAQKIGERCDVLSSQVDISDSISISREGPRHLIDIVKRKYNYITIDIPRGINDFSKEISELSEQKIIVIDASLPALRDVLRYIDYQRRNKNAARPLIVLNKLGEPGTLSLKEISDGLGRPPDVVIPFVPRIVNESEISGYPVAGSKNAFTSGISELVQEAASVSIEKKEKKESIYKNIFHSMVERLR
ncbi:AAA family ATPase [Acetobacter conturbans]|uniref:AAA family ATPase n=1 Tax=Acetobacter conturbans TaxID=1737472 RepID=A0ABX0K1V8_9PROT|nr:AAA family ATPase [Acetobacter conturbans]NHN89699.1 AAA family ATPase [Acetobacter conturbans]